MPVSRTHIRAASGSLLLTAGFIYAGYQVATGQAKPPAPRAAAPVQGSFIPSTKNGDWPSYPGDARGSRSSPLAQITADNFNDLEVAWRFKTDNLGSRPEYKLEGTPLAVNGIVDTPAGTRGSSIALDGASGEV